MLVCFVHVAFINLLSRSPHIPNISLFTIPIHISVDPTHYFPPFLNNKVNPLHDAAGAGAVVVSEAAPAPAPASPSEEGAGQPVGPEIVVTQSRAQSLLPWKK